MQLLPGIELVTGSVVKAAVDLLVAVKRNPLPIGEFHIYYNTVHLLHCKSRQESCPKDLTGIITKLSGLGCYRAGLT